MYKGTAEAARVASVRRQPQLAQEAVAFFQKAWPGIPGKVYEDSIFSSLGAAGPLPQWYLLECQGQVAGGAGLIPNDFISRADLWPWLCALYVEPAWRGVGLAGLLIEQAKQDTLACGFEALYLATDHEGFYERYGFAFLATGYDVFGDAARVYRCGLTAG